MGSLTREEPRTVKRKPGPIELVVLACVTAASAFLAFLSSEMLRKVGLDSTLDWFQLLSFLALILICLMRAAWLPAGAAYLSVGGLLAIALVVRVAERLGLFA
jgi:Flp pilus assembly protein TadB